MTFPRGTLPMPRLDYPYRALEPYLGEEAVKLHFELWKGYAERHNALVKRRNQGKGSVKETLKIEFNRNGYELHQLFFGALKPFTPGRRKRIPGAITRLFGNNARVLKSEVREAGMSIEGSGWVGISLVVGRGCPEVWVHTIKDHSFDYSCFTPLLLIDAWEHSFLPDYGADKRIYFGEIWHLVDWDVVLARLEAALS